MTIDWKTKQKYGQKCSMTLTTWIRKQFAENPNLTWSDEKAWDEQLLLSGIMPYLRRFHCLDKDSCDPDAAALSCSPDDWTRCDSRALDVFQYIVPVGADLELLKDYLHPSMDSEIPTEIDYQRQLWKLKSQIDGPHRSQVEAEIRRLEEERVRVKVIWSFVVDWVEKNVLEQKSQKREPATDTFVEIQGKEKTELDESQTVGPLQDNDSKMQDPEDNGSDEIRNDEEVDPDELQAEEKRNDKREWMKGEDDLLRELCKQELSWEEIAQKLYPRTRYAVKNRAAALEIKKTPARSHSHGKN